MSPKPSSSSTERASDIPAKSQLSATSHPSKLTTASTSLAKNLNLDAPVILVRRHIHRQVIQMINQLLKILRLDLR